MFDVNGCLLQLKGFKRKISGITSTISSFCHKFFKSISGKWAEALVFVCFSWFISSIKPGGLISSLFCSPFRLDLLRFSSITDSFKESHLNAWQVIYEHLCPVLFLIDQAKFVPSPLKVLVQSERISMRKKISNGVVLFPRRELCCGRHLL